jgi:hypothetical protein
MPLDLFAKLNELLDSASLRPSKPSVQRVSRAVISVF